MNATIPILLFAPFLITGLAAQQEAQQPSQPKVSSRRPVDVSVEGLGVASRRAPGNAVPAGRLLPVTIGPVAPLFCLENIADQATSGCLTASSTPTLGLLYPYPGLNNMFVPQAFVGGGENNEATGPWSTIGGGRGNAASGTLFGGTSGGYATVAGGKNNQAIGPWSTIGGGSGNTASGYSSYTLLGLATVGGGVGNNASGTFATVSGGATNRASEEWATVGGGDSNLASGRWATIAGGFRNTAHGTFAAVAGGRSNTASGSGDTVGGGQFNVAYGGHATVGGGYANTASGSNATVGGGYRNTASGFQATVPGGALNTAFGSYSFAAGRRAKADHNGAFVWGDTQDVDKTSSGSDQFSVYCRGGARFFSNATFTTGVLLAAGGSTWTMVSDRDAKENVEPVDARAILDKVAQLPLATWNYKDQSDSIRHMGPMAQDFYTAFGLGLGDKTIDTIDPNGVALAAIQGLNELVRENEQSLADKDAEIEELRTELVALRAEISALASRSAEEAERP